MLWRRMHVGAAPIRPGAVIHFWVDNWDIMKHLYNGSFMIAKYKNQDLAEEYRD